MVALSQTYRHRPGTRSIAAGGDGRQADRTDWPSAEKNRPLNPVLDLLDDEPVRAFETDG
jgi:hypothetical protein